MIDTDILTRIKNVYSTCSPTEQKYLQMILQEISATGESSTYRDIWLADYKEIPVGIDTFVTSDRYMGLTNQQGSTVYPFWRKTMREIFNAGNKYEEIVFTGATRIGKTSTAVLCAAYMLYRLMCLRDPQRYFGKKDISKFSIMFFNITKDLAKGVAFREFQDSVLTSPWFLDHGIEAGSDKNPYYIPEGGKVVIDFGSDAAHGLGKQVFCGIMDECNFSKTGVKDVSKAKQHMQDLYNTISARIQGTFRMGGSVYGKLFAVSSKRSDSDFMEAYIETQISSGAGEHLYVADAPQWEVLPESMFSKEKFTVAVGDRYRRGFVVDTEDDAEAQRQKENELISQGYRLIHPPLDMRPKFLADFDIALRDLAGISIAGSLSFITQAAIDICKGERRNAFINDILEIGNKDKLTIEEFFHTEYVPQNLKIQPMCVHLDLSLTTDRTGISGVVVSGRKDIVGEDGKTMSQPVFAQIFSIALEAPRGDKIPYSKITSFICWLRRSGFNIQKISRDQYQSEYMAQLLEAEGFDVDKISLDRTPDGYTACRSIMLEQRIDMVDWKLLEDEMIHLQRDSITGRVDHPMGGSKDVADSFAGALWTATLTNPGVVVSIKTRSNIITSINSGRGSPQNHGVPNVISHIKKLKGGR